MVPSVKSQKFDGLFFLQKKKKCFFLFFLAQCELLSHKELSEPQFPKCSYFIFSAVFLQLILYNSA